MNAPSWLERVGAALVILQPWCTAPGCPDPNGNSADLIAVLTGEPEGTTPINAMAVVHRRCADRLEAGE